MFNKNIYLKFIYIIFIYLADRLFQASQIIFHTFFMDLGMLIAQPSLIGKTCIYQHFGKTTTNIPVHLHSSLWFSAEINTGQ